MSPADLEPLALIAAEVAAEWGLELGPPFALARYSYVAPVGEDAVLKVTPAEDDEADEEPDALALWDGDGAVRLLRRDRERRAVLIERARPGNDISEIPEDEATAIAVAVPELERIGLLVGLVVLGRCHLQYCIVACRGHVRVTRQRKRRPELDAPCGGDLLRDRRERLEVGRAHPRQRYPRDDRPSRIAP